VQAKEFFEDFVACAAAPYKSLAGGARMRAKESLKAQH
jgi:hypothetical protein